MPFEILEHTADVGVRASGATFDDALAEAVRGFFAIVAPDAKPEPLLTRTLVVDAPTLDRLVVETLDEINFLTQTEGFLASDARVTVVAGLRGTTARLQLRGEAYQSKRHGRLTEIKATTFHNLVVREDPALIEVIFDI